MSQVGIIGTGVIGAGWAARFLANGFSVKAWDPSSGFDDRLQLEIERLWPILEKQGVVAGASIGHLHCADSLEEACEGVVHVQESAPENLDVKQALHRQIDACTNPEVIIASSSSGLLPSDIQRVCQNPDRFLIGHPFNPVYLLPLVEVVAGKQTSVLTVEKASAFYKGVKMRPLIVRKEIEGYLSDRLQEALWREILHLVNDDIADTGELDEAIIYGPGLRWAIMGTCLTFHLAGGPGGMRHMLEQFGPALELPWTHLKAPELTDDLIEKMVDGTSRQAGTNSIEDLENLRDNCLIELMQVLEKYRLEAANLAS